MGLNQMKSFDESSSVKDLTPMFAQKAQSDSAFGDYFNMSNQLQVSDLLANQQPGLQ